MKTNLYKTFIFLFLLLIGSLLPVKADLLCSNGCNLVIEFTGEGTIEAVQALTITFGNGGLIDTGASSTSYVDGDSYPMNAGETLTFQAGGEFNLGQGGNIDYSVINFTIKGDMTISAVDGGDVNLLPNSSLSVDGDLIFESDGNTGGGSSQQGGSGSVIVGANVTLSNVQNSPQVVLPAVGSSGTLSLVGGTSQPSQNISFQPVNAPSGSSGGGSVILSNANITTPRTGSIVIPLQANVDFTNGQPTSPQLTVISGSLDLAAPTLISGGSLQLEIGTLVLPVQENANFTLTPEFSSDLTRLTVEDFPFVEGMDFPTSDGRMCKVQNETCVSEDGQEYQLRDGKFVPLSRETPVASGGGGGPIGLPLLSLLLLLRAWWGHRRASI